MSKIKNFFRRLFHWFSNNVWLQLVLIVSGIFSFIFTLPIIVKKIKEYKQKRQDPEYFYSYYQVSETDVDQTIDNLKDQSEKKLLMFTPKQNSIANEIKSSLEGFVKQQKNSLQVIIVDEQKFPQLFHQHYHFFDDVMNKNQYLDSCSMPEIKGFDDFLTNPVLILWHQKNVQRTISNVCGDHDNQKISFLKHFWDNNIN